MRTLQVDGRSGVNRRQTLERILAALVLLGALATVPLTILEEQGATDPAIGLGNWAIWSLFVVEFVALLVLRQDRWSYVRRNWLNLAVIVLSFPEMPALLALARLSRLSRLFRLLRLLSVTSNGVRSLGRAIAREGVLYLAAVTAFVIVAGAGIVSVIEPETFRGGFWDGLWWGFVTATTVGYGDLTPTTVWGRVVAIILMISGVGLFSMLSASAAAFLVRQDAGRKADGAHHEESNELLALQGLSGRLELLERSVRDLSIAVTAALEARDATGEQVQPVEPLHTDGTISLTGAGLFDEGGTR